MKTAFMLAATGVITSRIVARTTVPTGFHVGELITFGESLDLGAYGLIKWGTRASVVSHDFETGLVELELRGVTPELAPEWGRCISLMPFQNEDCLCAINATVSFGEKDRDKLTTMVA